MPTPKDELWIALSEYKYDDAIGLINKHTGVDLINSVNEKSYSVFMKAESAPRQSIDFMKFVVSHPQFKPDYKVSKGISNIDALISTANSSLLEPVIKNPYTLFNGDELTYQLAKKWLDLATLSYNEESKKDINSKRTQRSSNRVENLTKMVSMLRDATILHGISNDDVQLFDRLNKAGARPHDFLSTKELPGILVKRGNKTNLLRWFREGLTQSAGAISDNPNSFVNTMSQINDLEKQKRDLEAQKLKEQSTILKNGLDNMTSLASSMI